MTVNPNNIDLSAFIAEHLGRAEPDPLRSLSSFIQALTSAEADAACGAPYGHAVQSGPTRATAT
jgi:putative transposase